VNEYIKDRESIANSTYNIKDIVEIVINRFIAKNPKRPFIHRVDSTEGIHRKNTGEYNFDFAKKFPEAEDGSVIISQGLLYSESKTKIPFYINPRCPTKIWVNDDLIFESGHSHRSFCGSNLERTVELNPGSNHIIIKCKKSKEGFGLLLGTGRNGASPVAFPIQAPIQDQKGRAGWIYTKPLNFNPKEPIYNNLSDNDWEAEWLPKSEWQTNQSNHQLSRILDAQTGQVAIAWTKIHPRKIGNSTVSISGKVFGSSNVEVFFGGDEIFSKNSSGEFQFGLNADESDKDLIIKTICNKPNQWGFVIDSIDGGELVQPHNVSGIDNPWFYIGGFKQQAAPSVSRVPNINNTFDNEDQIEYWRVDVPDGQIRTFNPNSYSRNDYGTWSYPHGVILYGILIASNIFGRADAQEYARSYINECTQKFDYGKWDKDKFGVPNICNPLFDIQMLDDCGSMGIAVLEAQKKHTIKKGERVVDIIGEYVLQKQPRLGDDTFYRPGKKFEWMKNTVWADDLYMSVPFLLRYHNSRDTDDRALQLAIKQFRGMFERLYMEQLSLLSHVYDLDKSRATDIAWGRGNGWALLSLSEALMILNKDCGTYSEILEYYKNLSNGILRVQGNSGLWHQVLTNDNSYPETSCTAMFVCALARGIRHGWLNKPKYYDSVIEGWKALINYAVDYKGNMYGISYGSEYSFDAEYYAEELSPITNDPHGIGVFLLAAAEIKYMMS